MRNLAEYPITAEEVQRVLTRAESAISDDPAPGDTGPYCLKKVSQFLELHAAEFDAWIVADFQAMIEEFKSEQGKTG